MRNLTNWLGKLNETTKHQSQRIHETAQAKVTLWPFLVLIILLFLALINAHAYFSAKDEEATRSLQEVRRELEHFRHEYNLKQDQQDRKLEKVEEKVVLKSARLVSVQRMGPVQPTVNPGSIQELAKAITVAHFGEAHWAAMHALIMKESGYNVRALNPTSGACGLAQFLPCNKYGTGPMIDKSPTEQLTAMCKYVAARYGNPSNALAFHQTHNWY